MKRLRSAIIAIILIISGVSAHAARAGVREGVHTGFAAAQGQKSAPQDIFARFMTATFSAIAAESVGKIYAAGGVDPIIHKILHGGIGAASGGILGGKDGALSGASSAVIAETLADIMRPQVEAALTEIAKRADSAESYHTQAEEYLNTQHNLILLTSVAITASLGGDVDQATCAADNALKNNAAQLFKALVKKIGEKVVKETVKGATKDAVKTAVKEGVKKEGKKKVKIRPGQEWKEKIVGTGQKTKTEGHAFRSYREAIKEAKKPDTEKVFLDRGINRAADNPIKPNRRPDVTVLKKDGKINQIEVPSKTDRIEKLDMRMNDTRNKLPQHQRGDFETKLITRETK